VERRGRGRRRREPAPTDGVPVRPVEQLRIPLSGGGGVDALRLEAPGPLYIFAHGAGAGMRHPFMTEVAERLQRRGVASLRFDFPCISEGRRLPPRVHTLTGVVRDVVAGAKEGAEGRPLWAGGKSMGGRVASMAEAEAPLGIDGLLFLGFPLHPAKRPGVERAEHLRETECPLRFISGTRDALARGDLLDATVEELGERARLHPVEAADHGFDVLVRSGRSRDEVLEELVEVAARWIV